MKLHLLILFIFIGTSSFAQNKSVKQVSDKALELHKAIFIDKDSLALENLLSYEVNYGHSGGKVENRKELIVNASHNKLRKIPINENNKLLRTIELENNLIEIENLQVINCLTSTTNYLLVGCNNFAFKFNIDLRIITQVFPSYGEVNAIAKQFNNEIYIGCNCNRLLKYNSNGKLISELKVSSYCIQNVMYMNIFNRKLICCSGISNYIDFIADDIILRLIF